MGSAMNLTWYTHLKDALAEVHMTTEIPRQDTEFVTNFIQRLQSSHKEEWAYNIQATSKLDSFARYKTELNLSKYLSHIPNPFHLQS